MKFYFLYKYSCVHTQTPHTADAQQNNRNLNASYERQSFCGVWYNFSNVPGTRVPLVFTNLIINYDLALAQKK